MACINMFNPEQQGVRGGAPQQPPPMGPRISFSGDFAVEPSLPRAAAGPADPDFEFAVGSHPMMAADQLFFKGRILPLKDSPGHPRPMTTLRDELRAHDHAGGDRPPKGSLGRWKDLLGLKKAHHPLAHPRQPEKAATSSSSEPQEMMN